jgi:hypothetical protein
MNTQYKKNVRKLLVWLPLVAFCGLVAVIVLSLFAFGYVDAMLHGPKIVLSVPSPDGAYVEEGPSIDPPNQSLWVERGDKIHFMPIAGLAEDVDFIKQIVWSPDSDIVVFQSKDYLTATRVTDWQTVRIYLGKEWRRSRPQRHHTTFTSGGVGRQVVAIEFPKAGSFAYRLNGDDRLYTVRMDSMVQF